MKTFKLTLAIGIAMSIIATSCRNKFDTTKTTDFKVVPSTAHFERGKVLVFSICAGCHYDRKLKKFIGTPIHDIPGIAGKVYSANLTHSKEHGLTDKYSDAEIRYLLKTGIARDGRFLNYMLRPNMADEDIDAIITYLRSNDPPLQAADTTVGLTHFTPIGKFYMSFAANPAPYRANVKLPSMDDKAAMGYYLVDNLGCFHCHSKKLTSLDFVHPDQTKGYLAGGIKFKGPNGTEVRASNITPDKTTGIGNYSQRDFLRALKEGVEPNGDKLKPPMPRFTMLKDEEINDIYAYLQTVPLKSHKIE